MVEVTQEDHGCAADVEEAIWNESEDIAVIIARHRTAALAAKEAENAELRAKVDKLREALVEVRKGYKMTAANPPEWFDNVIATLAETQP